MNKAQRIIIFLIFVLLAFILITNIPDCKTSTSQETRMECYSAHFLNRFYYFLALSSPLLGFYFLIKNKEK